MIKVDVTILSGTAVSPEVAVPAGYHLGATQVPPAWTTAELNVRVGYETGHLGTMLACTQIGGNIGSINAGGASVNKFCLIPPQPSIYAPNPEAWNALKFVAAQSGTDAGPVNQGADRVVSLYFFR